MSEGEINMKWIVDEIRNQQFIEGNKDEFEKNVGVEFLWYNFNIEYLFVVYDEFLFQMDFIVIQGVFIQESRCLILSYLVFMLEVGVFYF